MESDANYSNDSIAEANHLVLEAAGAGRSGTIAGTIMATGESVDEDYYSLGTVDAGESILVSLRLPASSSLVRPVVEIRDSSDNPLAVVVSPIETAARAHITTPGTYYVCAVTLAGRGSHGQYLMDAAVWPTSGLDFPDLVVSEVTAPAAGLSGETVRVSWTVQNFGTGTTYDGSWYDRVVLSANGRYGDSDDIELARVRFAGTLDPDQQYAAHADVRVPIGLSGVYNVFIATDDTNRMFEYIFEGNNITASPSPLGVTLTPFADLETSGVTAPPEIRASDPATITWSVTNQGAGTSGDGTPDGTVSAWIDRIIFSRNTVLGDADDRLVADVPHSGALQGGESYAGSWTGQVPGSLSGDYYVFVAADWGDAVYEHDDAHSNVACSDDTTFVRQWIIEPGALTEDTVWDGLLKVLGTVTVPSGKTLTIQPGSIVKFVAGGLNVEGTLNAIGTVEEPIIFSSWADDSAGGDSNDDGSGTSPTAGDWQGLAFTNPVARGALEDVEIRYANTAVQTSASNASVALRRAVLRNNNTGIYSWSTYAEIEIEDSLIVGNNSVMRVGATTGLTFRNCTVVGNADAGQVGNPVLTIENSIFAFNTTGLSGWLSADDLSIRNSIFYEPVGPVVGWVGEDVFHRGGNLTADPLFVDRAAGNCELASGSPAIDAGRGIGASATDFLGRPRYDDPGMANVGAGSPSYVDIGALERQELSPAADLAVSQVSDPGVVDVMPGDTVTINWRIANTGESSLAGPWQDAVYLSSDPYLSLADDRLLGRVSHSGGLDTGAVYNGTWSGQIPADIAGPQYILVYANEGLAFRESSLVNNVLSSQIAFAVDVPILTTATPQTGTISEGEWRFFRFDAQPGQSVRFALDAAGSGATQLYVRRGAPPTVSVYDAAGVVPNQPDQEARLLSPAGDSYYIGVFARSLPGGSSDFTLSAELTDLRIRAVSSNRVGNAGRATVKIVGDNFTRDSQASLVAADGSTVEGDEWFQDASTLFATFDLAAVSAAPGVYDVVVTDPGVASVTKFDALTVDAGGAAEFETSLVLPGRARPNRQIEVRVEYRNTGNLDLASPLLTVESVETVWVVPQYDPPWVMTLRPPEPEAHTVVTPQVSILAISLDGPASILRPGESAGLTLTVTTPFNPADMPFTLYAFGAPGGAGLDEPIDWNQLSADLRPVDTSDDAWLPLFERLEAQVGTTWGDYLNVLRDNADHLAEIDQRVCDLVELFGFEFAQAAGMGEPTYLATAQDAFCPAPGMALSFDRYFLPDPFYRARLEALGRGWTHSYEITLQNRSDGSVVVNGSNGFDRIFEPDGHGGYKADAGDYGRLTALPDNEFLLVEQNGLQTHFRSDGRFDSIQDTNGNRIFASYDALGRLATVTHSNGDRFRLEYNAAGRLVKLTDHAGRLTQYGYDATGEHLISVTGPDGQTTTYTYLTGENILKDDNLLSISPPGGPQVNFCYDNLGRLAGQSVAIGEEPITYTYSTAGKTAISGALANTTTVWMDSHGWNAMIEDPLGCRSRMRYDTASNLTHVVGPTGLSSQFTYDSGGNLVISRDPIGYETAFGYGGPYDDLLWVRDAAGNATHYSYDARGNLTSIAYADDSPSHPSVETWTYDSLGQPTTYTNRRGNATPEPNDHCIAYAYNARGQLATCYGALGNRVSTTENGVTNRFVIDPMGLDKVVGEYSDSSNLVAHYDYGFGLVSRIAYTGNAAYYTFDALGTISELTSVAGTVENSYRYDPFGVVLHTSESIASPFEFIGRLGVMTDATGLDYMRARYYAPSIGRFTAGDPIGIDGGINVYGYGGNNPVMRIDPQGLKPGDRFSTKDSAGRDAIQYTNPTSISQDREYGGYVYRNPDGSYSYTTPYRGTQHGMSTLGPKPSRGTVVGDYHTHGAESGPDYDDENFSPTDKTGYSGEYDTGYLGTPSGQTKKYDAKTGNDSPVPPGKNEVGTGSTPIQTSWSPEDKWGPAGYDAPGTGAGSEKRYVTPEETFSYRVEMWNKPEAPVPTQDATIYDVLDANVFDLSTFQFTRIGFLRWDVPLAGGQTIETRIDCRPDMNIAVDVRGTFDPETGRIDWWFHTVDPLTGDYPADPMAGFLPPFNPATGYEIGWMEFTVKPKTDLPTGTQIANQAFVQFDFLGPWGPAPKEGPWINTIDAGLPASSVDPLPAVTNTETFTVTWSGVDDMDGTTGSGVRSFDVFVSTDDGPFELWLDDATDTSAQFTGLFDHTYAFYSVATDNVSHVEDDPGSVEAVTTVVRPSLPIEVGSGTVGQGNAVRLPVRVTDDAAGLRSALLVIHYDTAALNVTNDDIALGGLLSGLEGDQAWTLTPDVDDATGTITALIDSASLLAGGTGDLLEIVYHAAADAPLGDTPLDLDQVASYLNDGGFTPTAIDGTLTVAAPGPAWQNPNHPLDVNPDFYITTQDALLLANFLYYHGQQPVPEGPGTPPFPAAPPPYYDVSGDGYVSTQDVLLVANFLYHNGQQPVGEGTPPSPGQGSPSSNASGGSTVTRQDVSAIAAASTDPSSALAPTKAPSAENGGLFLFMENKLTPPIVPDGSSRGRVLADISIGDSGPIQQGPSAEGTTASTQPTSLAALFLDEAIHGTIRPGDSLHVDGRTPVGVAVATSTITDFLRKGYTHSPAGRVASRVAAVDRIMADIFRDGEPDYANSNFANDVSRTIWPISDGMSLDDFFGRFQGPEEPAVFSGYADEV